MKPSRNLNRLGAANLGSRSRSTEHKIEREFARDALNQHIKANILLNSSAIIAVVTLVQSVLSKTDYNFAEFKPYAIAAAYIFYLGSVCGIAAYVAMHKRPWLRLFDESTPYTKLIFDPGSWAFGSSALFAIGVFVTLAGVGLAL